MLQLSVIAAVAKHMQLWPSTCSCGQAHAVHVEALMQQEKLWLHLSRVIVHLLCHEWFLKALAE